MMYPNVFWVSMKTTVKTVLARLPNASKNSDGRIKKCRY